MAGETFVLGIGCYYHDSSAALIRDGQVVAAAAEERFTRKKHDTSFPKNAIQYCLQSQGITMEEVSHVGYYEKPLAKFERVLHQHLSGFPHTLKTFADSMPSWMTQKLRVHGKLKKEFGEKEILFIDHHLSHAASCFHQSPFEEAAIFTVDGVGEWSTTTYGVGKGTGINLLGETRFPHSLGLLYSTITAYLGFSVNNSEYKVMGLSPYGLMDREKNQYYRSLMSLVDVKDDGSFRLNMDYFSYHVKDRMPHQRLCRLLAGPVRERDSQVTQRHKDIAAALQMTYEDITTKMLIHVHEETGMDELAMAGGCALNSVYNGKILSLTPFKRVWIQPAAGDGGSSLGAAAFVYHSLLKKPRTQSLPHAYLGPGYTDGQIKRFLDKHGINYSSYKDEQELVEDTAQMVYDNQVVGWFQGRMEWGPRALGARSILANPCNPDARELLNSKVKHRETFRPFAPVVCMEDASKYFECDEPVPEPTDYMLMVYPVRRKYREEIPSVTHVDGSGRLQSIRKTQNPLYHSVIREFGSLSGTPILINTSFNIRGEPIVCTAYDAYKCMMGTGIDATVMGGFKVLREENPQDMWDSESTAVD